MKQGICLGRPPARSNLLLAVMLVAAGAGALVLAGLYQRGRTEGEERAEQSASRARVFLPRTPKGGRRPRERSREPFASVFPPRRRRGISAQPFSRSDAIRRR